LQQLISKDENNADVSLMFDGMAIKKGVVYDKSTGQMEGFVDLGQGISDFDDGEDEDDDTHSDTKLILFKGL
jgi:hypothetical protein